MLGYSNFQNGDCDDFIDHLRSLYVAIDDERYCEYSLMPHLNATLSEKNEISSVKI
jgi:hypothetical protein